MWKCAMCKCENVKMCKCENDNVIIRESYI
jgi:hypothetical protein